MTKIFVGMSGGVDSSLAAALLKEQGHDVTGVYMKNWTRDLPGLVCPWREDVADAKRVALSLGIDFKVYDFQDEYRQAVVDYLVESYQAGITPNPDIVCNQEIKFKLFLKTALADGAEQIATGHYARTEDGKLLTAADANKDQTYFLYRVTQGALEHTLFPVGEYPKAEVRELAKARGLATAEKAESMGICFVGEIGIKEFLSNFVSAEPGPIQDQHGETLGEHDGALFFTIGQRHGLNIGGGRPYYVADKDMATNTVFVTTDLQDERLWTKRLALTSAHWINGEPAPGEYLVRTRHRASLIKAKVTPEGKQVIVELSEDIRAATPGQSAVIYNGEQVLGGGVISR